MSMYLLNLTGCCTKSYIKLGTEDVVFDYIFGISCNTKEFLDCGSSFQIVTHRTLTKTTPSVILTRPIKEG